MPSLAPGEERRGPPPGRGLSDAGDGDGDEQGSPSGTPVGCGSGDGTKSPGCFSHRSDAELTLLLLGTAAKPLALPRVCGEVVETPEEARALMKRGGPSPCNRFKRHALAAIFNIRRSELLGDGLLGDDGGECFGTGSFRIELRCDGNFVPDTSTPNPTDAVVITEETPIERLVDLVSQLCEQASCPDSNNSPCGKLLGSVGEILDDFNNSRDDEGECPLGREDGGGKPPRIDCPPDMELECKPGTPHKPPGWPPGSNPPPTTCTAKLEYALPPATDPDGGPPPRVTCSPPSGTELPVGNHTVTCRAVDEEGNEGRCTFKVKVVMMRKAFIRGDANADSVVDIGDPIWMISYLFLDGPPPKCMDSADGDDSAEINIGDCIYLLSYVFKGGTPPLHPFFPLCGFDETEEEPLDCRSYLPCE